MPAIMKIKQFFPDFGFIHLLQFVGLKVMIIHDLQLQSKLYIERMFMSGPQRSHLGNGYL
jgi:hypothetical protein